MNRTADDWDHARDLRKHEECPHELRDRQILAISKLIGALEGIVASGITPPNVEMQLRTIIAEGLSAFNLPAKWENDMSRGVQ